MQQYKLSARHYRYCSDTRGAVGYGESVAMLRSFMAF